MATNQTTAGTGIPGLGIREFQRAPGGGLVVQKLDRFGSSARAGVGVGDEIHALAGEALPAAAVAEFAQGICDRVGVGGTVQLEIRRGGDRLVLDVPLLAKKTLNLNIQELSEVLERKIAP